MRPESKWVRLGSVRVFDDVEPDKAQALKALEEAAEVFGAWQSWDLWKGERDGVTVDARHVLLDEVADTIQACCNLAAALGEHDMTGAMRDCRERNRERGRIADGR